MPDCRVVISIVQHSPTHYIISHRKHKAVNPISYSSGLAPLWELQRDMGPHRAVHIALHMFTHILQVNICFLYVQTRHIQILHCYICQVLLWDKYWVQGNSTRLVPHCHSCLRHSWQYMYWQQTRDLSFLYSTYEKQTRCVINNIGVKWPNLCNKVVEKIFLKKWIDNTPIQYSNGVCRLLQGECVLLDTTA